MGISFQYPHICTHICIHLRLKIDLGIVRQCRSILGLSLHSSFISISKMRNDVTFSDAVIALMKSLDPQSAFFFSRPFPIWFLDVM